MTERADAIAMLETMMRMQDSHNRQVHPDWRAQGYEYYRAIWVECAEMLDHFGWKWWKKQVPDVDQVKLELVDIWHFALSELLRANAADDLDALAGALTEASPKGAGEDGERFRRSIEALAASALTTRTFELPPFIAAMQALPMSYDELFALYVGKNVLNRFRQDHGYKTGEYRKTWGGREDNAHLVELLEGLDRGDEDLPDQLYRALKARYASAE